MMLRSKVYGTECKLEYVLKSWR